ncbi:MAG: hypothetical protein ACI4QA_07860 [Candidatus Spyradosoma sp.]
MSVKIICPRCGERYDAAPEYVGRQFLCKCGAVVAVPVPEEVFGESVPAEPPKDGAAPAGVPETGAPRRARLNAYGVLALVFGTTGSAALVASAGLVATAFAAPLSGVRAGDLFAAACAFGAFVAAFALAALFRLADVALRRSGAGYFF